MTTARTLTLSALMLTLLAGCGREAPKTQFQGYVEGDYLHLAAPDAGWLTDMAVKQGAQVAAGQALFALDATRETAMLAEAQAKLAQARSQRADLGSGRRPEELAQISARLNQARAALRFAESDYSRQRDLARNNVATKSALDFARSNAEEARATVNAMEAELATARLPARDDQIMAAEANVTAAEAAVAQAEWRLSQRRVNAPTDGLIDDIIRDPGEWVPAGGVVISLLPPQGRHLVFFVPEPMRTVVAPGSTVAVSCDGCPADLTARVSSIASSAEYTPPIIYSLETRAKLVYRVEARPLDAALTLSPGQPVDIRPLAAAATGPSSPAGAP